MDGEWVPGADGLVSNADAMTPGHYDSRSSVPRIAGGLALCGRSPRMLANPKSNLSETRRAVIRSTEPSGLPHLC